MSPASLTFTTANWNTAQTVTVTGVDDPIVDGSKGYTVVTAAATSSDGNYNGLNPSDVSATTTDNDTCPVTLTVTNTNDSGAGSLRQAMLDANESSCVDTIAFSIGTGAQTIAPTSVLPTITDPVVIDGTTQPGFTNAPLIELSGASAGAVDGLTISAGSSTVKGLIINRFSSGSKSGLYILTNGNNTITGNYIGTTADGTAAAANYWGIRINGVSGNTIGGTTSAARNVLSGNTWKNIALENGASSNIVRGNYIGTNAAGTAAVTGASTIGVYIIDAPSNTVGGTASNQANVISGNANIGVYIYGASSTGNLIQGNTIGSGLHAHERPRPTASASPSGTTTGNTIGGTAAGAGNIIASNTNDGVAITGTSTGNGGPVELDLRQRQRPGDRPGATTG